MVANEGGEIAKLWSWREELNLQPAVYKTAALPLSYASYRSDVSGELRQAASLPSTTVPTTCQPKAHNGP